ncbi:DNRLRE domain-containing protein [Streptomyces sp. NBC_00075]|uniref:LamG-like jellyroll fold domain-containing protein n=1 Tax=Streptomyces sp. NBC_00075 TaxID=2975641 RepID=UPI0032477AF8
MAAVMAGMGMAEGAAVAVPWAQRELSSGERPEQRWGTAAGRSHEAAADATDAAAGGGRSGHVSGKGELALDTGFPVQPLIAAAPSIESDSADPVVVPEVPQVKGFDPKTSREVAGERTAQGRTYRNADGTFTTQYYDEPVNFRDERGSWRTIDTSLAQPEGTRTMSVAAPLWETTSTEVTIGFAGHADADPVAQLDLGEHGSVGFAVSSAAHTAGQVDGSTITYPDVRASSDIEFLAGNASVKETLLLKGPEAPTEWSFPLATTGLTARLDDAGAVVFDDGAGAERARIPQGWMEDSRLAENADEGVISTGVVYSLAEESGRQVLKVSLDQEWLHDPARVFPVRVDPSVAGVSATSGTYVEAPYNTNFSTDTVLKAGTYDAGSHKAASFLRFSGLETTLKNDWVLSAKLNLYNSWSQSCKARPVTVHQIKSNWSESTTTKYPGPSTGSALTSKSFAHGWKPEGTENWSCDPAWEGISLGAAGRKLVDDWTHGRQKNYGLAVKASTTDSKGWKQFGSDDYPNGKPRLDVTWTKYGATYKLGGWVQPVTATQEGIFKVTLTNRGEESWTPTNNYQLRYDLYDADGTNITDTSTNSVWTTMPSTISPGETVTVDARIAKLTPGTYTLAWTMDDRGTGSFAGSGVPGVAMKFDAVNIPPVLMAESPASGVVQNTLTPTLWASGKDSDRYPDAALTYIFEVCEVKGSNVRANCRAGTAQTSKSWAVPSGWLSWGKRYAWYVRVGDGEATSALPRPAHFSTAVPQPGITSHLATADEGRPFGSQAGNYTTAATDAAVSTVGPELSVTRTYNSLDPRTDSVFGAGWSTAWDMRITPDQGSWLSSGDLVVTLQSGQTVRFGRNADGTYAAPSGGFATLKSVTAGGWTLTDKSATTYTFDSTGRLTKIADGAGRAQILTYTSGKLTTAKDALSGRTLTFAWTGGHVTQVTTGTVDAATGALTWTYTYSGDRLTRVCPPDSATACTTYDYTDGSLYRSTVLDDNPVSYWRFGEADGAAARSEAPSRSGLNNAEYSDATLGAEGALAGTPDTAASFDGVDGNVILPDNTVHASSFLTVELWFRTAGPGVLFSYEDERIEDGKPTWWTPALYVGTDGKLRGQFWREGGKGPITSTSAVNDNTWHHVVLSGAGTNQALFLDGTRIGTLAGAIDHTEQVYTYVGAGYTGGGWPSLDTTDTFGHFTGSIDEVAVYDRPLAEPAVAAHYAARQTKGRLTQATLPSGRVDARITYDSGTDRVDHLTDANGGTWQVSAPDYASGSAGYAQVVQASGPANYWRLGDRSGAAAASALTDGADGSYSDGVSLAATGVFSAGDDTAVDFDGAGGYAEVPDDALHDATNVAVELWFRTAKAGVLVGDQSVAVDSEDGVAGSWTPVLYVGADGKLHGKFYVNSSVTATSLASTATVTDGDWHHAVVSASGSTQTLYLDGVKQGTLAGAVNHQANSRTYIGAGFAKNWPSAPADVSHFTGQIDEVAVYQHPLDAATVSAHFRARTDMVTGDAAHYRGATGADAPGGYWRLDETTGSTARSSVTVNSGNGTYTNATLGTTGAFGAGQGSAVTLAGGGYAEVPGGIMRASTDLAAEMWFKTDRAGVLIGDQSTSIAGATAASGSWTPVLYVGADGKLHGKFYVNSSVTATPLASTATVTDNQWHHAVVSASGTTQTLYLDGVSVGTLTGAVSHQSNSRTYIGAGFAKNWPSAPADVSHFTGQIDEVAIYPHPLTEDQVAAHYSAAAFADTSALTSTVTVTDPAGAVTSKMYDALHGMRTVSATDAEGGVSTFAYDTGGYLHTATDPAGHVSITGHDKRGNTVSVTTCRDADSCWTSFTDYHLNTANELDPRNDKPTAVRDARSTSVKDDRFKTAMAYTALGLPDSTTLADGRKSTTTYTTGTETAVGGGTAPAGLVATETTPGGAVTTYAYFAGGDLARSTAPSGLVTEYTYDGLGRKTAEKQTSDTFPAGVTTSYTYDKRSRIVSETGAAVRNEITDTTHTATITRGYDEDGNLLTESTSDTTGGDPQRTTAYHYDELGLNDSVTDAEQNTTRYEHDALGRVNATTDAEGTRLTYRYTPSGRHAETVLKDWTGDPSGTTRDLVVVSNAYDPAGRLASTTDALGATTAYTYFDDGLAATTTARQVTQADGSRHDIVLEANEYDGAGHLTKQVTGGGAATETYTVDALGRTTNSVLDPGGLARVTTYAYDGDDRIKEQSESITADKKLTTTSAYDSAGNVTSQSVTDGTTTHTTTHTYDDRGLPLTSVSPRGNVVGADPAGFTTAYRYDALGRPVQETAPAVTAEENGATGGTVSPVTLIGYNAFGEATETKDARGKVTRAEVDRLGRTVAVTLPDYTPPGVAGTLTATTRTAYTPLGLPRTVTDPLGRVTRYGYDQFGQVTSQTDPVADAAAATTAETDPDLLASASTDGGGVTRYTWAPTGLQLSATDPTGARTEATYDELGRQLTATTVERFPSTTNLTSSYTWDDAGNQTASRTPAGRITSAVHNPAGEPTSVTDPAGTTSYAYDGLGRRVETTDATNRRTTTTYDALGNTTAATDYGTGSTALRTATAEFDADGNRTVAVSPQTGARTTYAYDAQGRLTTQTEPVSATGSITTAFGYDAAGNRTRLTDGRGNKTIYTFNSWGLPESTIEPATTAHPAAADRTWTTVYDKAGQAVTELLPGGVQRTSTYDALGRLTHETGTGAESTTTDRTLEYDLAGRLTATGTADALTYNTYTYNDRGQLLTAAGPGGAASYTYDADGNMTERRTGQSSTAYGYDSAGYVDWAWDSVTGKDIWYDFDAAGRPRLEQYASKVDGGASYTVTAKRTYTYDALGRLSGDAVTSPDGATTVASTAYGYDLDDNLTSKQTTGTAGAGQQSYGYDQAGRLTSWTKDGTTTAYEWDAAGNRTKAGSTTSTFDARNRRLTDGTKTFTYTARGTLSSVDTGTGTPRNLEFDAFERKVTDAGTSYTYDSLDRVQTRGSTTLTYDGGSNNLANDGTTTYNRTPEGALLSFTTGTAGTTAQLALTDRHTDLVAGLNTDATQVTGSTSYDPFGTETATNGTTPEIGYQSGWTDPTSGDVNMAARWYQPGTGAFASRDTWQLDPSPSAQANRQGYANGDPVNGTDPTGHVCACGGGNIYSARAAGSGNRRGVSGRGSDIAQKGYVSRSPSSRGRSTSVSGGSRRFNSSTRSQTRRNNTELRRLETRYSGKTRTATRTGSGSVGSSGRGCTYGCSTSTTYRNTGTTRGNGTSRGGTTRPPKPPTPQNPNRGKNPTPAPTRPVPKPRVDVARVQQQTLRAAVVRDQRVVIDQMVASYEGQYTPDATEIAADYDNSLYITPENQSELEPATGSPVNRSGCAKGNSAVYYMPLDNLGRAQGVRACLNKGDFNYANGKGDWAFDTDPTLIVGSGTEFPLDNLTSWEHQPQGLRRGMDRGHLLAGQLGGSGEDLRNLVPLFPQANRTVMKKNEGRIAARIQAGETMYYSVTPEYEGANLVPVRLHLGWIGNLGGAGYAVINNNR